MQNLTMILRAAKRATLAARYAVSLTSILLAAFCFPGWARGAGEDNDGVLNGPLTDHRLGHKASGEGDEESLRLAIEYLVSTYGEAYPRGEEFLSRLGSEKPMRPDSEAFKALRREALVDHNPALDFDRILLVRAAGKGKRYARNWQTRASCDPELRRGRSSFRDELVALSIRGKGGVETVYLPDRDTFVGDVDLHCDADRVLFTSFRDRTALPKAPGQGKGYAVFELGLDPSNGQPRGAPVLVSPDMGADVDCYDACYLPDDRVLFASTAAYDGVPCVGGNDYVANLFRMDRDGGEVRRLTFDQDGNWHPSMMENGRVMYLRWEYTDSAHYYSRVLMTMNPDGTDQKALYGSNSYWPNSMFFSRQLPGRPHRFVASITGHHSHDKGGALCLFDVSRGRHEAEGAVQFLTGRGKKVHPLVLDNLAAAYHPMFFNPFPVTDTFFLATDGAGAVFLLDVFDNVVCLKRPDRHGRYFEPVPLRSRPRARVLPDRVAPGSRDATVLINDVHAGPGLDGVPRGEVKALRVYRYEYGPRHKGGHYAMGMEAGWDAKQVLGVTPVEEDGSASFRVPANTPFAVQPLDARGRALQQMRSWTVAMPGEFLTCVGCHEPQNTAPPSRTQTAMVRAPHDLEPFYGPVRGFSFKREVQPVLDRYCVGCHDGSAPAGRYRPANRIIGTGRHARETFTERGIPDLSAPRQAHRALHPFVRRNGPEGDYHLLTPLEFHAGTSELFQLLEKGHHNVRLDDEAWERLYTWADLNAPFHGTWTEAGADEETLKRRKMLRRKYAGDGYDPEAIVNPYRRTGSPIMPEPETPTSSRPVGVPPAGGRSSPEPQVNEPVPGPEELDLGGGVTMPLVGIPSGAFSMGSNEETPMERPVSRVSIERPFLMGATEVTLRQYRRFDPGYLNGVYDMHYKDQVKRGYYMNDMDYPVIRVSWEQASAFCAWLSEKTGHTVRLPSEAQWEWACRAGTTTPLSFGGLNAGFSEHANLADLTVRQMAVRGVNPHPIPNPSPSEDYELKDVRSDDGVLHLAKVGSYLANPWNLHDMHGNAAEWTRSDYVAYPYTADARDEDGRKVVRGGSWHDRMYRASSSYRLGFPSWQRIYHVGFRVVVEE